MTVRRRHLASVMSEMKEIWGCLPPWAGSLLLRKAAMLAATLICRGHYESADGPACWSCQPWVQPCIREATMRIGKPRWRFQQPTGCTGCTGCESRGCARAKLLVCSSLVRSDGARHKGRGTLLSASLLSAALGGSAVFIEGEGHSLSRGGEERSASRTRTDVASSECP
jgi:hypothetical protein